MGFQKGHKKLGGKKKGYKSQKKLVREQVEEYLQNSVPVELLILTEGKPKDRLEVLKELMPYCYAKSVTVDASHEVKETSVGVEEALQELVNCLSEMQSIGSKTH